MLLFSLDQAEMEGKTDRTTWISYKIASMVTPKEQSRDTYVIVYSYHLG